MTGRVTSAEDGTTLPQLAVQLKGTTTGVATDLEGNYRIQVPGPDAVLVFTYVGMQTQEVLVGDRTTIDVVMQPLLEEIGTVMVLGYGTRGKNQVTGSSVQLGGKEIASTPVVTPVEALQGKVPGLVSNLTSSTPGSSSQLRIRGEGSMSAGNAPLYVIDGVPVSSDNYRRDNSQSTLSVLATLNMSDIETMTLLKDASATAAYGARGSNGVIVITTKRGAKGKTSFHFAGHWGGSSRTQQIPMMTATEQYETMGLYLRNLELLGTLQQTPELWLEYKTGSLSDESMDKVQAIIAGLTPETEYMQAIIDKSHPLNVVPGKPNVLAFYNSDVAHWHEDGRPVYDMQKEYEHAMANQFNGVLSASGGGEGYSFYTSLGANHTQNIVKESDFNRINGALNFRRDFTRWLEFSTNNNVSYIKRNGSLAEQAYYYSNPMYARYAVSPFVSPYDREKPGEPNLGTAIFNYLYLAKHNIAENTMIRGMSNSSLTATLFESLKLKTRISLDYVKFGDRMYWNKIYGTGARYGGVASRTENAVFNWVTQNSLGYDFTIQDDHAISLLALQEFQKNTKDYLNFEATSTPENKLNELLSFTQEKDGSAYKENWGNAAYLFMLNYGYKNRYILDATYRREASSRFPKDTRWGNFGSVGLAWNIHAEPFFEPVLPIVNSLRLRASYGITGNSEIALNAYQALFGFEEQYQGSGAGTLSGFGNDSLTWEKNAMVDLGFEFGLWNDRISGSFTFFNKKTYDLLQDVDLSRTTGFSRITSNVGEMVNRGVELLLDFAILRNQDYNLRLGLNMATLQNQVTLLAKDLDGKPLAKEGTMVRTDEGHMLDEWHTYLWAGVSEQTGVSLYYTDETRSQTTADRTKAVKVYHGASAVPKYTAGLSLHADWQGLFLDASLYYTGGHKILNGVSQFIYKTDGTYVWGGHSPKGLYQQSWTKPGDRAKHPIIGYADKSAEWGTDRFLHRGDHIRLRDITLGYNFPKRLLEQINFHGSLSIYAKGTNLYTFVFDKDLQFDPEVGLGGSLAVRNAVLRTVSVGINMNF